jgi:hypothetical protein
MCNICEKNNVQVNPVEFSSKFQESVWISVKLVGGDELLVGCIYRSNSGTDENNECLLKLLNEVNDAYPSNAISASSMSYLKFLGFTSVIPTIVGLWFLIKSLSPDTLFVKHLHLYMYS